MYCNNNNKNNNDSNNNNNNDNNINNDKNNNFTCMGLSGDYNSSCKQKIRDWEKTEKLHNKWGRKEGHR